MRLFHGIDKILVFFKNIKLLSFKRSRARGAGFFGKILQSPASLQGGYFFLLTLRFGCYGIKTENVDKLLLLRNMKDTVCSLQFYKRQVKVKTKFYVKLTLFTSLNQFSCASKTTSFFMKNRKSFPITPYNTKTKTS